MFHRAQGKVTVFYVVVCNEFLVRPMVSDTSLIHDIVPLCHSGDHLQVLLNKQNRDPLSDYFLYSLLEFRDDQGR